MLLTKAEFCVFVVNPSNRNITIPAVTHIATAMEVDTGKKVHAFENDGCLEVQVYEITVDNTPDLL